MRLIIAMILLCNTVAGIADYGIWMRVNSALDTCSTDVDSVQALCQIVWQTEQSDSDAKEVIAVGKLALDLALRTNDSTLLPGAYDAVAKGYVSSKDYDIAERYYQQALYYGTKYNYLSSIAWANFNLEMLALRNGEVAEAEELAVKAHMAFMELGDFKQANQCYWVLHKKAYKPNYIDSLIGPLQKHLATDIDEEEQLDCYLDLSRLYSYKHNGRESMRYVQEAMAIADKIQDKEGLAQAYYQIALYFHYIQRNYDIALTYYIKVLNQYKVLGKCPSSTADIVLKIGEMHEKLKNDKEALQYLNKGLTTGIEQGHRHTKATAYKNIGELNYNNGNYSDALHYFIQSYETGCDVCPAIKFHDVLVKTGEVYLKSGNYEKAQDYFQQSYDMAINASNVIAQSTSLQSLASVSIQQNRLDEGLGFLQHAYDKACSTNFLNGQQNIANDIGELYERLGNFQKAYQFQLIAHKLTDSITNINEAENMARLETYFDFQNLQTQRELDHLKSVEEIGKQKALRNYFIIGFIFSGLLGFLLFIMYHRKRKDNKLLQQQKADIEIMSQKVHEADQAKLQFFTNVSHELRTPLTLILGITEKLTGTIKKSGNLTVLRNNALRLMQLINHLLDLRKLDASSMPLKVSEGIVEEFVKGIVASFEYLVQGKSIKLSLETDGLETTAYLDWDKLEKILTNLLSNAIKYTHQGGTISIRCTSLSDHQFQLSVSDNGVGISEKDLPNIFSRFYRVSESVAQGTGIGLALVKELVLLHKGSISVESIENKGSDFKVTIPANKNAYLPNEINPDKANLDEWNHVVEPVWGGEDSRKVKNSIPDPKKNTLLIVEDNDDLRLFIADMFKSEYEVLLAENGEEGLKLSFEYVPDLIISDVVMPKVSGIEMLEKLKSSSATIHIPVILLTAKNDIGSQAGAYSKGADDYIGKPFESEVLKSRVGNLLRLRRQLADKFSKQFQLEPREIVIEDADQKFIQRTIDIIEKFIAEPNLNIDLLAIELGVSRTQLYRKLKALTDYSANQFIRIIRLKRAAQILKQGQNNIAEVMDATGFSNYSHFNNCFKEYYGEAPKEFMLKHVEGSLN